MSEDRRLRDKLARLASGDDAVVDGARRLFARPGEDLVAAILVEIDETILARRLTFRTEDGRHLTAEVANRRLLRLTDLPAGIGDPALSEPLGPESDPVLPSIIAALRTFAAGEEAISVETGPLPQRGQPDVLGRSAAALAAAAGIALYAASPAPDASDMPAGFAGDVSRIALAVRTFGPSSVPPFGPDADRLAALDDSEIADLARRARPGGDPAGAFLALAATGEDASVLFVGFESAGASVAALIPAREIGKTISLWRATRARE